MKCQIFLSFFYKFNLTSAHFNFIFAAWLLLHNAHVPLVVGRLLSVKQQLIATVRLGHIGYLEALHPMCAVPINGPQVEHMFNIFHTVYVAINVDIAVCGAYGAHIFGIARHLYARYFAYGAGFFCFNILVYEAIVHGQNVGWLSCFSINHSPDASAVSIHGAIGAHHSIVSIGKIAHHALYPRFNIEGCRL